MARMEPLPETQLGEFAEIFGAMEQVMGFDDTMATTLEALPLADAKEHLAGTSWELGKHRDAS